MTIFFCFAGKIGSGKTSVSKKFSEILKVKYASFGDYVRTVAKEMGLNPCDRTILEQIGQDLIQNMPKFCKDFLRFYDWDKKSSLVIDGIRHLSCIETLKKINVQGKVVMVYLDVDNKCSIRRQLKRKNGNQIINYDEQY